MNTKKKNTVLEIYFFNVHELQIGFMYVVFLSFKVNFHAKHHINCGGGYDVGTVTWRFHRDVT